ncbi:lipopolysaccharide biosynthesis protein [Phenylobacterium immobile]|uniref:lipopolysaccharide biosynthesis protein n=1 Tax=Phenylobacterium immobile TaxID=21 RepID=UPI00159EBB16|nr:lipopolysaccharide biosynthesis protein [Phenylobacterium immobile]
MLGRVLANTGVMLGGRIGNAVLSLSYLAVAARALDVRSVGVLVLINAFAQLVGEVVKFNSWQTVLHYGADALERGDTPGFQQVVRFTLFLDVLSSFGGIAIAIAAALIFGAQLGWTSADSPAAAFYCLSIALMVPATPIGLLRLFNRFDFMTAQAPIQSGVRLAGSLAAWALAPSLTAFLLIWAAGTAIAFLYLAWVSLREMRRRGLTTGFRLAGPMTRGLPGAWRFAWATNAASSLDVAFTHAITLVVGALVGPAPAALWRIGRQVADALGKPAKLLVPALYPELARLRVTEGERAMRKLALQVGVLGGGVGTVLLVATAVAGRPLLTLVMGPAFADAAGVMVWQVAAAVIGIWALPLEPMLVSLGRPGDAVKVRIVVAAALLAALPWLVKAFGPTGAGAGLVVAMAALAIGMFFMLQRRKGPAPDASCPLAAPLAAMSIADEIEIEKMACVTAPVRAKGGPQ